MLLEPNDRIKHFVNINEWTLLLVIIKKCLWNLINECFWCKLKQGTTARNDSIGHVNHLTDFVQIVCRTCLLLNCSDKNFQNLAWLWLFHWFCFGLLANILHYLKLGNFGKSPPTSQSRHVTYPYRGCFLIYIYICQAMCHWYIYIYINETIKYKTFIF